MHWLREKKEPDSPSVIFDIGSGGIAALIIDHKGCLAWSNRIPLSFGIHEDYRLFERETLRILDIAAAKVQTAHPGPYQAIHCLLSSPWHIAEVRHYDGAENSLGLSAGDLEHQVSSRAMNDHLERHRTNSFDLIPIDNVVLRADGDTSVVYHFSSSTDRRILETLKEHLEPRFRYQEPNFHSSLLATFAVTNEAYPGRDYALLDIAGELTDVIVVRNNTISHIASFPIGKYTVARRLAERTGESPYAAYSRLKLWSERLIDGPAAYQLESQLADIRDEWRYTLDEALEGMEKPGEDLPLVVVGDDAASFMIGRWAENGRPEWRRQTTIADHEFYADLYPDRRTDTKDIPVLIAGLFAGKFL